jgi:hypothetical protein
VVSDCSKKSVYRGPDLEDEDEDEDEGGVVEDTCTVDEGEEEGGED